MTDHPVGKPDAPKPPPAAEIGTLKRARKPFPWPFLLAVAVPLVAAGLLAWLWHQDDFATFGRTGWICLVVIFPGFSVMTLLGGVAQLRRRPILSTLALLLAIATVLACAWGVRVVTETPWLD